MAPDHAYLGLSTTAAPNGGAQIAQATAGGPAEKAGLTQGDVVTKVDGEDVQTPDDVAAAIEDNKPGDQVDVTVAARRLRADRAGHARPASGAGSVIGRSGL